MLILLAFVIPVLISSSPFLLIFPHINLDKLKHVEFLCEIYIIWNFYIVY